MNFLSRFRAKDRLREQLLQAEANARVKSPTVQDEAPMECRPASIGSSMTEAEERHYHRIMAMLHFGEESANPDHEAFLAQAERDWLESYAIQRRWAKFWAKKDEGALSGVSKKSYP